MTERIVRARWVRFSRYELQDGHLRPAGGATAVEYDPWQAYEAVLTGARREDPRPYHTLLDAVDRLRFRPADAGAPEPAAGLAVEDALRLRSATGDLLVAPTPDSTAALLAWCAQYGLLGLLPHQVVEIFWPPGPSGESVVSKAARPPEACVRELRPPWDAKVCPVPVVWAPFFPELARRADVWGEYPMLGDRRFWRHYAEPLVTVLEAAIQLRQAIRDLAEPRGHASALERLLAPMRLRLDRDPGGDAHLRWGGPSLLAFLALMAVQDTVKGRCLRFCLVCRTAFVAVDLDAVYCRTACRRTEQKRRQRAKAKRATTRRTRRASVGGK